MPIRAGKRINRFLHVATSAEDLVMQNKMQRRLGQLTGTRFQRCVGMDAINSLHLVIFEIDRAHEGRDLHPRRQGAPDRVHQLSLASS